jgi:hypothetical protein
MSALWNCVLLELDDGCISVVAFGVVQKFWRGAQGRTGFHPAVQETWESGSGDGTASGRDP